MNLDTHLRWGFRLRQGYGGQNGGRDDPPSRGRYGGQEAGQSAVAKASTRLATGRGLEKGWLSLRSVGSAQSPELRPSGVDTSRRHLLREYGVQRLVRLGSGAALAPRFCETNRIGFGMKTGDNILRWNWMRKKRVRISIRFVWRGNDIAVSSDSAPVRNAHARFALPCGLRPRHYMVASRRTRLRNDTRRFAANNSGVSQTRLPAFPRQAAWNGNEGTGESHTTRSSLSLLLRRFMVQPSAGRTG